MRIHGFALVFIGLAEWDSRRSLAILLFSLASIILLCAFGAIFSPTQQDAMNLATQEDKLRDTYKKLVKAVFTDVVNNAQQNVQLSTFGNEPLHVQQRYELILQHAKATLELKCAEAHLSTMGT